MFAGQHNPVEGQLHVPSCTDSAMDIERMRQALLENPEAISTLQAPSLTFPFIENDPQTPLHDACELHHKNCVKFLLECGADPSVICTSKSALEKTLFSRYRNREDDCIEVTKMLLNAGASPNVTWREDVARTGILARAIECEMNDAVKLLLEYGAETEHLITNQLGEVQPHDCEFSYNKTPIQKALFSKNSDALTLLFLHGSDMNLPYKIKWINNHEISSIPHLVVFGLELCLDEPEYLHMQFLDLPDVISRAIKLLQTYQMLGGNMWTKERDPKAPEEIGPENVLELLNRRPQLAAALSPLQEKLKELMPQFQSLSQQCRIVIQKSIGRKYWKNTDNLELPRTLSEFLRFNDYEKEKMYNHIIPVVNEGI